MDFSSEEVRKTFYRTFDGNERTIAEEIAERSQRYGYPMVTDVDAGEDGVIVYFEVGGIGMNYKVPKYKSVESIFCR